MSYSGFSSEVVGEIITDSGNSNGSTIFRSPPQPHANGGDGSIADHNNWSADDYINNLWEPLRNEFPGNITRELLGKDQSGTLDIWKYTFSPENYSKTIILTCNVHGYERISQTGTFLMLRHIYEDWKIFPELAPLRFNVRFVVIPILNPWGLNQSPPSRYNSRGVDINRNWDYRHTDWDESLDSQPKGPNAFSEIETQYAKSLLDENPNAIAYFDMHDLNGPGDAEYTLYGGWPMLSGESQNIANDVINSIKKDGEKSLVFYTQSPNAFNYAISKHGMIAANPEANTDGSSNERWTSLAMTRAVEFWTNLIIETSSREKLKVVEPFTRYISWSAGQDSIPRVQSNAYSRIDGFTVSEEIKGSGFVKFSGSVSGTVWGMSAGERGRVYILPSLGHGQNPFSTFGSQDTSKWEVFQEAYNMDRLTIYFEAIIPVAGDYSSVDISNILKAGLLMKCQKTTGESIKFDISRYSANLEFIPSNNHEKFKWYRSTGNMSSGEGAMQEVDIY